MAVGDVTDGGPYDLPLSGDAKAAIKALRNSANDHWSFTVVDRQLFVINIEES